MKQATFRGPALLLLFFAASPAFAAPADDVRCMMASNFFAKTAKQEEARKVAEAGRYFFLGRVGHMPAPEMKRLILAQQRSLTAANAASAMKACARQMEAGLKRVQSVTAELATRK